MPKVFVEEPFCAVFQNLPLAKKFLDKRGGIRTFRPKNFISQCQKFQWGCNLLVFHKFPVSKKLMLQRVKSLFFLEIFCLALPKNFVGEPFCVVFQRSSGSEKVCG